jgi:hypothetical protein
MHASVLGLLTITRIDEARNERLSDQIIRSSTWCTSSGRKIVNELSPDPTFPLHIVPLPLLRCTAVHRMVDLRSDALTEGSPWSVSPRVKERGSALLKCRCREWSQHGHCTTPSASHFAILTHHCLCLGQNSLGKRPIPLATGFFANLVSPPAPGPASYLPHLPGNVGQKWAVRLHHFFALGTVSTSFGNTADTLGVV